MRQERWATSDCTVLRRVNALDNYSSNNLTTRANHAAANRRRCRARRCANSQRTRRRYCSSSPKRGAASGARCAPFCHENTLQSTSERVRVLSRFTMKQAVCCDRHSTVVRHQCVDSTSSEPGSRSQPAHEQNHVCSKRVHFAHPFLFAGFISA